jgi:hypothetical protein
MDKLKDRVDSLSKKIALLADIQMLLITELGDDNPRFQAKVIASLLSKQEILDGFTEFVFNSDNNVSDNVKLEMQEINEMIKAIREEE